MRKRGQPMGPVLLAVLDVLRVQSSTARDIAGVLKLSMGAAKNACRRLHDSDLIYVRERRSVRGSNKPARVYAVVQASVHRAATMHAHLFSGSRK